jgi:helix-turn-helix, Psq domain
VKKPKKRKKKTKKRNAKCYSQEDLDQAIIAVIVHSMPIRAASKEYEVPRSTLQGRLKFLDPFGKKKPGRETELEPLIEEKLVDHLVHCARIGFPMCTFEIQILVHDLIEALGLSTSFEDNTPSISWVYRFLGRHSHILRNKTSEHHSAGRAAVTEESIKGWFSKLFSSLRELNLLYLLQDPKLIFNMDESGFNFNLKKGNNN